MQKEESNFCLTIYNVWTLISCTVNDCILDGEKLTRWKAYTKPSLEHTSTCYKRKMCLEKNCRKIIK